LQGRRIFSPWRDATRLRAAGPDLFTRDARGRAGAFTVATPRVLGVRFERRP
jgi:hypothetical protein